ncbi:hypothetical protein HELRODRAFT_92504, partial [Helobdella robusta]|uniref:SH2 domain-containing protein n=1 Tax=Helobdella robusta TaxID=6412 RepID=T1G8H8_HELRO
WYHGRLDRAQAEKRLLEHQKLGSYLIRESDRKPGAYVLSFLGKTGINHFKMTAVCGAYYIGGREFNSLSLLIGYYTGWSDLLKGERLAHPVPPPERVCEYACVRVSLPTYAHTHMHTNANIFNSFMKGEIFMVKNDMGAGWLWVTSTFNNKSGIINQELTEELGDDDDPVEQHKWYHSDITSNEVAEKLAKSGQDSWLVKRSEKTKGDFTIYFYCGGSIQKFKVQKQSIGVYFMGGRCFKSVADVIERYKVEDIIEGHKLTTPVLMVSRCSVAGVCVCLCVFFVCVCVCLCVCEARVCACACVRVRRSYLVDQISD